MFVFIASLRRELRCLKDLLRGSSTVESDKMVVTRGTIEGNPVSLVLTGMGKGCAQKGAHLALRTCRPDGVFSIGYAGALRPAAKPGDLVLATSVAFCERPQGTTTYRPTLSLSPDAELLGRCWRAAEGLQASVFRGSLLTLSMTASAGLKAKIAARSNAVCVDMESYWTAEVMARSRVPFAMVRAISDGFKDDVPDFGSFVNGTGDADPAGAIRYFSGKPQEVLQALRLRRSAVMASHSLGRFALAYLRASGTEALEPANDQPAPARR